MTLKKMRKANALIYRIDSLKQSLANAEGLSKDAMGEVIKFELVVHVSYNSVKSICVDHETVAKLIDQIIRKTKSDLENAKREFEEL